MQVQRDGGYAVLRGGGDDCNFHRTFDCGFFSRCKTANHGHADALSFELYARGRPLIVDPGVYLPWSAEQAWTRYFRSTAAHNTLVIDGKDQSELSEYGDVHRTAATRREVGEWAGTRTIAAAYRPYWSSEIEHRRKITDAGGGRICVRDRITGAGRHRLEWYFHFAHDLDVVTLEANVISLRSAWTDSELLRLRAEGHFPLSLRLIRGRQEPPCGWVSLNSAQVVPAWVAHFSSEFEIPCVVDFELQITS